MFLRFILRALEYRKQRLLLAFSALSVAATLATVLFGIYSTSEKRIRDEFRSYGANLVAAPAGGNSVPLAIGDEAEKLGAEVVPFLVTSARAGNETVAVVCYRPGPAATRMTSYWHVTGSRDIKAGECLAGELIAGRLGLQIGQTVSWAQPPCTLKGIIATGGAEDQELLVPGDFTDQASFLQLRVPGDRIAPISAALAQKFPGTDFRTVRSIADTESSVVLKVRAALLLLTLVILVITTLCVSSNFSEMVIERSKEIGIMKALGAAERKIAAFFVSESAVLALASTVTGYAAGVLAAAAIGRQIFGGAFRLQPDFLVFLSVAAVMLTVAALATAIATSRIRSIQPAIILRGE
jgi:putative ABC transport system permease protein